MRAVCEKRGGWDGGGGGCVTGRRPHCGHLNSGTSERDSAADYKH